MCMTIVSDPSEFGIDLPMPNMRFVFVKKITETFSGLASRLLQGHLPLPHLYKYESVVQPLLHHFSLQLISKSWIEAYRQTLQMTPNLPPGFQFNPSHLELVLYYLLKKVLGEQLPSDALIEGEVYGDDAQLPGASNAKFNLLSEPLVPQGIWPEIRPVNPGLKQMEPAP